MSQIQSYAEHAFVARQTARLAQAFHIPLPPPPRESFLRWGAYDVHLDEHLPPAAPRGTVLLIHGGGAHGRMLAPFAGPLLAQGFRVLAPDLPGFGLTRGPCADTTYPEWIELVTALADQAAAQGPVVLFGLSVGGLTAVRAAQRARRVAGVVVTTLIDLADPAVFDRVGRGRLRGVLARAGFALAPGLMDRLALPLAWLAPLHKMTSDRELASMLNADPLLGQRRVSLKFFRSLHSYAPAFADQPLSCPLLLVHPGQDRWTEPALSRPTFDAVRGKKELVLLRAGEHAPLEPEAFSELSLVLARWLAQLDLSARRSLCPEVLSSRPRLCVSQSTHVGRVQLHLTPLIMLR